MCTFNFICGSVVVGYLTILFPEMLWALLCHHGNEILAKFNLKYSVFD